MTPGARHTSDFYLRLVIRTVPNNPFYKTKAWHRIRVKVLIRDGYRCRMCGADVHGKHAAQVDHKIPRHKRPDLALAMSNLQTLCTRCHTSTKQILDSQNVTGCDTLGNPPGESWD